MAEFRETATQHAAEGGAHNSERQRFLVTNNSSVTVAIAHCDTESCYKFVNRNYAQRYGLTPEQIVGRRAPEVVGEKAWSTFEHHFGECLAGKVIEFDIEVDLPCQSAQSQILHCLYEPEWRDGKVIGLIATITNVTDLRRAEQRLRASEVTLGQLVASSPFGIYVVDADFRIVHVSAGAESAFKNFRHLIGSDLIKALRSIWPDPLASDIIGRFRQTLETGEPHRAPATVERRMDTGIVEAYDWQIERLTMPDGRSGVVCHFYNFSERQKYENALRESEETFRAMFDVSSVGKVEIEIETGRFLRANAAMCKFLDYNETELLARTVYDVTHADYRESARELCRRLDAGETDVFDVEKRYVRKDGSIVWGRTTVNLIQDAFGRPLRHTAVIQDLSARKQAEWDLQASKERLQLAFDATQLGWWQYDPLRRVGRGDTRAEEIFDVTCEATIEELMKRIHPDDMENVWASIQEAFDPAKPKPLSIEYRVRHRDGQIRWVENHGLAYFEGSGHERRAISLVGTIQDITERKEREERERLLMREINHRAKNMLSVVNAIAHQTAATNAEDFIERFSERIQALAANQDLLIWNDWNGVEIKDLIRAQLAPFANLIGSRIGVHGPELRLNPTSAQAIGLVLHELATNAGKYGALSTHSGSVNVGWGVEGDTFTMSWIETDGPQVSAPERRGFGTMVIEVMAKRSVAGTVDLDYAPSGLTWRLTAPAANTLDRDGTQITHLTKVID